MLCHLRAGLRYALTFDCIVHSALAGSSSHCAAAHDLIDLARRPAVSFVCGLGQPRFVRSRLGQVFARGAAAGRTERDVPPGRASDHGPRELSCVRSLVLSVLL